MPHQGNIDGRSLAPDISQGLGAVFQAFGTTKSERDAEERRLENKDAVLREIGFITRTDGQDEQGIKIRKDAMARLAVLNPNAARVLSQIGKMEDEGRKAEAIKLAKEDSEKSLQQAKFFQTAKDKQSLNKLIVQEIQSKIAEGAPEKEINELMELANKPFDEQTNVILRQELAATEAATLTSRTPVERFEPVKDSKGNIIAQKNTATGQVTARPDAKESTAELIKILGAKNYTPQSVRIALTNEDVKFLKPVGDGDINFETLRNDKGEIVAQRNKKTGEVKTDPRAAQQGGQGGGSFVTGNKAVVKNDKGEQFFLTESFNKATGKSTVLSNPIKGQIVSRALGETPLEKQTREIETAGGKTLSQQLALIQTKPGLIRAERETETDFAHMDAALVAAENIPALEQNLILLQKIETGGVDAIALATKRKLGLETADEAELVFNLRKNVLKQLKPTFGSAFTEKEGRMLTDIEASDKKSTPGNIRLIKRALGIYNRSVDRGLRAAKRQGNKAMIEEINAAMAKLENLDIEDSISTPANPAPPIKTQQSGKVGRFTVEVE